jgi:hypothetical protein
MGRKGRLNRRDPMPCARLPTGWRRRRSRSSITSVKVVVATPLQHLLLAVWLIKPTTIGTSEPLLLRRLRSLGREGVAVDVQNEFCISFPSTFGVAPFQIRLGRDAADRQRELRVPNPASFRVLSSVDARGGCIEFCQHFVSFAVGIAHDTSGPNSYDDVNNMASPRENPG